MLQKGKLDNTKQEKKRMKIKIVIISKARWQGTGKLTYGMFEIFYAGGTEHERGMTFKLDQDMEKKVRILVTIRSSFTFKDCRKTI